MACYDQYSVCEPETAGGASPWHIRKLTAAGRKLGGGADTKALCGRKVSWDINTPVHKDAVRLACALCVAEFNKDSKGQELDRPWTRDDVTTIIPPLAGHRPRR